MISILSFQNWQLTCCVSKLANMDPVEQVDPDLVDLFLPDLVSNGFFIRGMVENWTRLADHTIDSNHSSFSSASKVCFLSLKS